MREHGESITTARFWDGAYRERGVEGVSWFQEVPEVSLELIGVLGVPAIAAVIDVGGGASRLVDGLVERGFGDLTVLDVSEEALGDVSRRLATTDGVELVRADLLEWVPPRRYDLWHDRAVFHFLVDDVDRQRYLEVLRGALVPAGAVVVGTFAPDAPEMCSGLPVVRYSAAELAATLGDGFEPIETRQEEHVTPRGAVQPFTWVAGRLHV